MCSSATTAATREGRVDIPTIALIVCAVVAFAVMYVAFLRDSM